MRHFIGWDGEGVTDGEQVDGLFPSEFRAAVEGRSHEILGEARAVEAPVFGALEELGLAPTKKNVTQHLDLIAQIAKLTENDVLDFLEKHPRRTSERKARQQAHEEMEKNRAHPAPHRYVMLARSDGEIVESLPGRALSTKQCFDFLLGAGMPTPGAVHVMYGGSYDVTKMLCDIAELEKGCVPDAKELSGKDAIAAIVSSESDIPITVEVEGRMYSIQYLARKYFKLARFSSNRQRFRRNEKGIWRPDFDAKIHIWDVVGFFQAPFVDALKAYGISAPIEHIAEMKARRSFFTDDEREEMALYCISECKALVKLMAMLADNLNDAELFPTRWDGPGAVASALLRTKNVKAHISLEPDALRVPVACGFFGGRIELLATGFHQHDIYGYDIASAYPWALAALPSSLVGVWKKQGPTKKPPSGYALCRLRFRFPMGLRFYPLPYRWPNGSINIGDSGAGWYWLPEVLAAIAFQKRFGGELSIEESWVLDPALPDSRPFGFIPELFTRRQVLKRAGNGAERGIRLALNALYGKTVQQVGATEEELPPYLALPWGGWITSSTRARLIEAALTDPGAIIAFATDGIYSTAPLTIDSVPPKSEDVTLGCWEGPSMYSAGVFAQAGVYWLRKGEQWKAKYRGFDREAMLTPEKVLHAWRQHREKISIPVTRFVTYPGALASEELWPWAGTWRTAPRDLNLTGKSPKRLPMRIGSGAHEKLVPLSVRPNRWYEVEGALSEPYASVTVGFGTADHTEGRAYASDVEDTEHS